VADAARAQHLAVGQRQIADVGHLLRAVRGGEGGGGREGHGGDDGSGETRAHGTTVSYGPRRLAWRSPTSGTSWPSIAGTSTGTGSRRRASPARPSCARSPPPASRWW